MDETFDPIKSSKIKLSFRSILQEHRLEEEDETVSKILDASKLHAIYTSVLTTRDLDVTKLPTPLVNFLQDASYDFAAIHSVAYQEATNIKSFREGLELYTTVYQAWKRMINAYTDMWGPEIPWRMYDCYYMQETLGRMLVELVSWEKFIRKPMIADPQDLQQLSVLASEKDSYIVDINQRYKVKRLQLTVDEITGDMSALAGSHNTN